MIAYRTVPEVNHETSVLIGVLGRVQHGHEQCALRVRGAETEADFGGLRTLLSLVLTKRSFKQLLVILRIRYCRTYQTERSHRREHRPHCGCAHKEERRDWRLTGLGQLRPLGSCECSQRSRVRAGRIASDAWRSLRRRTFACASLSGSVHPSLSPIQGRLPAIIG